MGISEIKVAHYPITKTLIYSITFLSIVSCLSVNISTQNIPPLIDTKTSTYTYSPEPTFTETPILTETKTPKPTKSITWTKTNTRTRWITGDVADISSYYGNWIVTRYEFYGGGTGITDEYAEGQIEKEMQLTATEIQYDEGFLWLPKNGCINASYISTESYGNFYKGMLPTTSPEARKDRIVFLIYCNGNHTAGFEISYYFDIVFYYDNYFFFLEKYS